MRFTIVDTNWQPCFTDYIYKLKVCCNPMLSKHRNHILLASCLSSILVNSHNILNPPPKRLYLLKAQIMVSLFSSRAFLMKTYALFRHSAISYLTDCIIVYTTLSHAVGNWKFCMICFIVIFALMQWSGAKSAQSPGLSVYH